MALNIGWGQANITPDQPVCLAGQFHKRVSEGVADPISATALALESAGEQAIMVTCDYVTIPDGLRDAVRKKVKEKSSQIDTMKIFISATHTHTAPEIRDAADAIRDSAGVTGDPNIELDAMKTSDYLVFASERIAAAIVTAWETRKPGGISFGLGQAVVGHNRRSSYFDGSAAMYGNTNDPNFSHIEGYEDHSLNLLCTHDTSSSLTGVVINVACSSQVSEHLFEVSADFWHEVRQEVRKRLGENMFILPQCSAAGDQSPHIQIFKQAEERMRNLAGRSLREEIAVRIADAIDCVLPLIANEVQTDPVIAHTVETVDLERATISEAELVEAEKEAAQYRERYENLLKEIEADPDIRKKPRWYVPITQAFRRAKWFGGVAERKKLKETQPTLPVEVHVVRVGDIVFATNPFEYYLDYGCQIKAQSKATQTFVVQLTGSGTYVPTKRAAEGRSYGAVPASTPVGYEGGLQLVRRTVEMINSLWG